MWRVRRELGLPLRLGDGSTDANAALWLGVPALALGCAHGRNMHAADEAIDVASVSLGYAQLERVVRGVLAG